MTDPENPATGSTPDATSGDAGPTVDTASDTTTESAHHGPRITPMRSGVAMMLVGAVALFAGMLTTTSATPDHSQGCPDGTVLVASFSRNHKGYSFQKPQGNENVVKISNANEKGGYWTSTTPITSFTVKGSPGSKTSWLDPAQTQGWFSNKGVGNGNKKGDSDIVDVTFCGKKPKPTTTTESTTTTEATTTTESTTTTEPTTTTEATTTTEPTTTTEATTTTEGPTSTTASTTSTTISPEVANEAVTRTSVDPKGTSVAGTSTSKPLALTGGSSLPLVVIGAVLLIAGATISLVARSRQRQAQV